MRLARVDVGSGCTGGHRTSSVRGTPSSGRQRSGTRPWSGGGRVGGSGTIGAHRRPLSCQDDVPTGAHPGVQHPGAVGGPRVEDGVRPHDLPEQW
ncbi:predicted protein [Streptomyces lividans TK24]|nr:predicted protein [Streptomyces lividans TK24]